MLALSGPGKGQEVLLTKLWLQTNAKKLLLKCLACGSALSRNEKAQSLLDQHKLLPRATNDNCMS